VNDLRRKQEIKRMLFTLLVTGGVIYVGKWLSPRADSIGHIVVRSILQAAALAIIPVMLSIWPVGDEKPVSMRRWLVILSLYCLLIIASYFSALRIPGYPNSSITISYFIRVVNSWQLLVALFLLLIWMTARKRS